MWQTLVRRARQILDRTRHTWWPERSTPVRPAATTPSPAPHDYQPLEKIVLSEGVSNTLFEDFAAHRAAARAAEETGWILMGYREPRAAVITATLPAGTNRDAGVSHVRFDSAAQAFGSRILRQKDKRLMMLGVAHTHPGNLRRPSDGDRQGDSQWVQHVRGGEGVFAIGTAESTAASNGEAHSSSLDGLFFSWYALRHGDADYRPLPLELTPGPDMARSLHPLWPVVEAQAERLDRLHRQQLRVACEAISTADGPALALRLPLAGAGDSLCVLLRENQTRYFLIRGREVLAADSSESRVDVGVYLLLAELAKNGVCSPGYAG
jgi:proteasome lid subunit RPN8/RPN11